MTADDQKRRTLNRTETTKRTVAMKLLPVTLCNFFFLIEQKKSYIEPTLSLYLALWTKVAHDNLY